ncbi:MAG: redoxin domain-containing protein [Gemmataceae bacterium]
MKRLSWLVAATWFVAMTASPVVAEEKKSSVGKSIENFKLQDFRGKTWSLKDFDSRYVVVAFIGTECPLVKLYGPRLQEIANAYKSKGVTFVGINPNYQDDITEIAAYARRHKINFPILKDLGNKVADQFGASRTPEMFVLDEKRVVRYQGRIDDQYGVGYIRDKAKAHFLKNALDAVIAGKKVNVAHREAVGCIIGRLLPVNQNSKVTYTNQIARILQKRCVECHRKGEIAPFSLTKYEEVKGWAEMIAEVVDEGRMPPWHANPKYGHFSNDRSLTKQEKEQIFEWVKNGAPKGDPKDLPEPKKYVTGWQLPRKPDATFTINPRPFKVQAQGTVRYQHFLVRANFKEDKWVQAAQIVPGNRAVVHHILAFAVDPKNGIRGLGEGAGGFLAGYVPGQRAYSFPKGMAKKIPAGWSIFFQVHYTPVGTVQYDQSKIGFVFADPKTITHEVKTRSAVGRRLNIPPNDDNYKKEATSRFRFEKGTLLLGFMPHMHLRGKSFKYEARIPGQEEPKTLLDVPNYDFNWQTSYRLAKPLSLPKGTQIHCTAHWDNSEWNLNNPDPSATIRWGQQTEDEMMIGYFDLAVPVGLTKNQTTQEVKKFFANLDKNGDGFIVRSETPKKLLNGFDRADLNKDNKVTLQELQTVMAGARPAPAAQQVSDRTKQLFQRLDKNKDGKIVRSEVRGLLARAFDRADRDSNGEVTPEELEAALRRRGR